MSDISGETFGEKQLLDQVERFRRERDSGRRNVYDVLTGEEWEALLLYDDQHDAYRRGFEIQAAQGFAMMAAVLTAKQ